MARIVCVHGIAQEFKSSESLLAEWVPSLRGGVSNAHGKLDADDVEMAFYAIQFRPGVGKGGPESAESAVPNLKPGDLDALEAEMLAELAVEAQGDPMAAAGASQEKSGAIQRTAAQMLQLVGNTPFFGKVAQKFVIWNLRQVSRYVGEPSVRAAAQKSLLDKIGNDTRIVLAHSLGTLVAFETLAAHPQLPVHTLITIGSPLGMPALLGRLKPPVSKGKGQWPAGLAAWTNIADSADIVALQKKLAPLYDKRIVDHQVNNGATMHNVQPYLTAVQTGEAIIAGLAR